MDAAAWLARFAEVDDAWRTAAALRHRLMGERIARELHPVAESHSRFGGTVILEPGHEIDSESDGVPSSARSAGVSALALGWAVRHVRSVAAVPRKGVCTVVTLRARRHDERLWAAWWQIGDNPARFDCAQYWRAGAPIELLGWRTVKARRGVMDALEGRRLQ